MAPNEFRMEHDFLGDHEVPADAYYGAAVKKRETITRIGFRDIASPPAHSWISLTMGLRNS